MKQLLGDSDGLEDEENHSQDRTEDRNKQRKELEEKKEKILSN